MLVNLVSPRLLSATQLDQRYDPINLHFTIHDYCKGFPNYFDDFRQRKNRSFDYANRYFDFNDLQNQTHQDSNHVDFS